MLTKMRNERKFDIQKERFILYGITSVC